MKNKSLLLIYNKAIDILVLNDIYIYIYEASKI